MMLHRRERTVYGEILNRARSGATRDDGNEAPQVPKDGINVDTLP
jgi:hypothetical protein